MTLDKIQTKTLIRVVDDDEDLRDASEMMLSYAGWRVKTYPDARSFLIHDAPSEPGCVILDINMPGMSGTELQVEMNARGYDLPVIVLTGHATVDIAVATFRAGAMDFLRKPVEDSVLLAAIQSAATDSLRRQAGLPDEKELALRVRQLSEREFDVFRLTKDGMSASDIADRLGISVRTVYEHRTVVYRKLGCKNFSDL